jgi:hypothetical protein
MSRFRKGRKRAQRLRELTRDEAIRELRAYLVTLVDEEHSICQVAAERNIFCRGFRRLDSTELREKYAWIQEKADHPLTRPELEERANTWELARRNLHDAELACDSELKDRDQCLGWDEFSDARLIELHDELLGERVEISH